MFNQTLDMIINGKLYWVRVTEYYSPVMPFRAYSVQDWNNTVFSGHGTITEALAAVRAHHEID